MELYFSPYACSLASHIVCREARLPVTLRRVSIATKEMDGGGSFLDVNPKGQVPTLRRDDGSILTEGTAVLQYLADQSPQSALTPPAGSDAHYRMLEWLNFISTELHKRILYMIFSPDSDDAARSRARAVAPDRLARLADTLDRQDYLLGNAFSVVDAYLLWWLLLAPRAGVDLKPWPGLERFVARCLDRPQTRAAVEAERALL